MEEDALAVGPSGSGLGPKSLGFCWARGQVGNNLFIYQSLWLMLSKSHLLLVLFMHNRLFKQWLLSHHTFTSIWVGLLMLKFLVTLFIYNLIKIMRLDCFLLQRKRNNNNKKGFFMTKLYLYFHSLYTKNCSLLLLKIISHKMAQTLSDRAVIDRPWTGPTHYLLLSGSQWNHREIKQHR